MILVDFILIWKVSLMGQNYIVLYYQKKIYKKVRSVDFNLLKYYEQAKSKFVELLASQ